MLAQLMLDKLINVRLHGTTEALNKQQVIQNDHS